jgi:ParB family transcriptional regulator, chromosome partitioning protein
MEIQIDRIVPNPEQPRRAFDSGEMDSLASSIRQHGVINPIAVEQAGDLYILIDGERRWRAARAAGLKTIPAEVRPAMNGNGQTDRLVLALVANLQRADMNPIEEARACLKLTKQGLSNTKIAHLLGKYPTWVANRLNLLEMDEEIQDLFAAKYLPADVTAVNALRQIRDPELRVRTARRLARPGQTIKVVEVVCTKVSRAEQGAHNGAGDAGLTVPAIDVAQRQHEARSTKAVDPKKFKEKWSALALTGAVPPWSMVVEATRETCEACAIFSVASEKNCRDCPGVDLVKRLMDKVNDGK